MCNAVVQCTKQEPDTGMLVLLLAGWGALSCGRAELSCLSIPGTSHTCQQETVQDTHHPGNSSYVLRPKVQLIQGPGPHGGQKWMSREEYKHKENTCYPCLGTPSSSHLQLMNWTSSVCVASDSQWISAPWVSPVSPWSCVVSFWSCKHWQKPVSLVGFAAKPVSPW